MERNRTRRTPHGVLAGVTLALSIVGALAVAAPAKEQQTGPTLQLDHVKTPPGSVLVLHGRGFPQDAHVTLRVNEPNGASHRIGGANTGRRGDFVATVRLAPEVAPGRYVAVACHHRCQVKATVRFRVVRP